VGILVGLFGFDRWDQPDLAVQPSVVVPVDVLGEYDHEVVDRSPRTFDLDQVGLELGVESLREGIVVGIFILPTETTAPASARRWV